MKEIDDRLYERLALIGVIPNEVRSYNIGASDYSKHLIQPWSVWADHQLNPWDADIIKRVLREKTGEARRMEYQKIIHICEERIRQIDAAQKIINQEQKSKAVNEREQSLLAFAGGIDEYKYIITK